MTFYKFITAVKQEVGTDQLTQEQASLLMQKYYLKGKTSGDDIIRAARILMDEFVDHAKLASGLASRIELIKQDYEQEKVTTC